MQLVAYCYFTYLEIQEQDGCPEQTRLWLDSYLEATTQIVLPGILHTGDKSNSMILPLRTFSFLQTCMADCISIGGFLSHRPDEIGCLKQQLKIIIKKG